MGGAKTAARYARGEGERAPPRHIVEITARAVAQGQLKPRVAGNDVLVEQRLNRSHVVADDGRRRRNDVFHGFKTSNIEHRTLNIEAQRAPFHVGCLLLDVGGSLLVHSTTSVPTPASVEISSKVEWSTRPSTNDTLSTPALSAATALSTFGIMPLSITPACLSPSTSPICRCEITLCGSLGSRSKPGTSLMNTSRFAFNAMAACAAARSALQL